MFDPSWNHYPNPSKRNAVYAKKGMVATSQPLAAQAGLDILKKGGNAIDAAIATAACLTVVEPTSNGIGGDAFALVYFKNHLHALNASGKAPELMTIENLKQKGFDKISRFGFMPVIVPGVPSAWAELSHKFGNLPLIDCLRPAIDYAKHGYPVSEHVAKHWANAFQIYQKYLSGDEFAEWFKTFSVNGQVPKTGDIWKLKNHAVTLESIGLTDAKSFYQGEIADLIDAYSLRYGGFIRKSDLEAYSPLWVDPVHVHYKGYDVWEIPPNGQGMIALQALNLLKTFDFNTKEDPDTYHHQIEAMKLAFSDGLAYYSDAETMTVTNEVLLSNRYADERRLLIKSEAALPQAGKPFESGTVYLATADGDGNMVSYIQSNYMGFGSGLVVPGTGIALQNRGLNFSLDPKHPNALAPFKRPFHTIIPGFLTKDGKAIGPFGVMGGFMQPQGHLQILMNTIDFHMNPQAAIDAPRWQWMENKTVLFEPTVSKSIIDELSRRGHEIKIEFELSQFGRGQIIWRNPENGVLCGGTEMRCDGSIASY